MKVERNDFHATRTCIVPGSFDPVTRGHIDIICRAGVLFDRVIVGVLNNLQKNPCFSLEKRQEFVERACRAEGIRAEVVAFEGLLADLIRKENACAIVRGLRGVPDFNYESQFASLHRQLLPDVETVCLMQSPKVDNIASNFVRDVGRLGGDISAWVPECIWEDVKKHLNPEER